MHIKTILRFIVPIYLFIWTNVQSQNYPEAYYSSKDSIVYSNLQLPENWHIKDSKLIDIPIKIYKSSNPKPLEPIFWLSGGPGMTNLDYIPSWRFLQNHDVILIGYRGVDSSEPLDCPEVTKALKGLGSNLLSKESVLNIQKAATNCANRLLNSGIDLNGYTIEQVLLDLNEVRKKFGIKKINILSGSYGTRVAQLYAKHYPEYVNRSVMIGASAPGRFVWEPEMINTKIEDYNLLCQESEDCAKSISNLNKTFDTVLKEMPSTWMGLNMDPGKVRAVAFGMLYHKGSAVQAIDAFKSAEKGDYSGIALMSLSYNYIMPKMMIWGDFFSKGLIDYDGRRNYWEEFNSSDYTLGSPLSSLLMDVGKTWPVKQPNAQFSSLDTIRVSTLILNGSLDFSTPHQLIEKEIVPFHPNSNLIVFKGLGHVTDLLYKRDIIKGIKNYYLNGEVHFNKYSYPVKFTVPFGFSKIMKTVIVVVLLVSIALFFLIRKLWKKFKHKKKEVSKSQ